MKRIIKITAVLFLALVIAAGNPLHMYAANSNTLYVSDVMLYYADSYEEAKEELKELGYTIVKDLNFNAYTEAQDIYLGYKTTTNPDEAITDIASMNMLGNYSYSEYKDVLQSQENAIMQGIEAVLPAIYAYQECLEAGYAKAELAKTALNMYYDDDSGKHMGDYLENFNYDNDIDELTDILLQSNSKIMLELFRILAYTADYCDEETIFERIEEIGVDNAYEAYKSENAGDKHVKANFERVYGDSVVNILDDWNDLYAELQAGKDALTTDANGNLVLQDENDLEGYMSAVLYSKLKEADLDGTLEESFMRTYSTRMNDFLYCFAYAMTDAQRSLLLYLSPLAILQGDIISGNDADSAILSQYTDYINSQEAVSVYAGINRDVFQDGVAFTSEATKHESLTGSSWYETEEAKSVLKTVTMASGIVAIVSFIGLCTSGIFLGEAYNSVKFVERVYDATKSDFAPAMAAATKSVQVLKAVFGIMVILCIVAFVTAIVSLVLSGSKSDEKKEELIPEHIVTAKSTDKITDYVYYTTVKDQDGDPGDLNNHEGSVDKGWFVLYYSKDELAGDPIVASSFACITGNSASGIEGKSGIHMFNETAMVNLTSENYKSMDVNTSEGKGLYVCYSTDANARSAIGTVASLGNVSAATLIGGLIGGIIIGTVLDRLLFGKKKEQNA